MKPDRVFVFKMVNILLFAISVIAMAILGSASQKYLNDGVFYVSPIIKSHNLAFAYQDIEGVKTKLSNCLISFEATDNLLINAGAMNAFSKVTFTDCNYVSINNLQFLDGWFWTNKRELNKVIVISEALAWKLFGNISVVGNIVETSGVNYKILGVVAQDEDKRDQYFAWIPYSSQDMEVSAESLYIKTLNYDKINSYKTIEAALTQLDKNVQSYRITDMNEYVSSINRRYIYMLSLAGCYIILLSVIRLFDIIKALVKKTGEWNPLGVKAVLYVTAIVIFLSNIDFEIWVPGFRGGGISQLFSTLSNIGLLPYRDYLSYNILALSEINAYAGIAFLFTGIALINFIFINRLRRNTNSL